MTDKMKKVAANLTLALIGLAAGAGLFATCSGSRWSIHEFIPLDRPPVIEPDFADAVIPPNITPLNFVVSEKANRYWVKISGNSGNPVLLSSKNGAFKIPRQKWKYLLKNNHGKSIRLEVFALNAAKQWVRYAPIKLQIAEEPIDRYLVYRFLRPNYTVHEEMQLRQRDLTGFDDSMIMTNRTLLSCINCHTFNNNNPSDMLFHLRWGDAAGTLFSRNGKLFKVDTRTPFNDSPGAYASWHPSGNMTTFSVNKVYQFFHASGDNRDVIDFNSDLIIYRIDQNMVTAAPAIAGEAFMETFPAWAPDGTYLYFCRAPRLQDDFVLERDFGTIKYDLMRIAYDLAGDKWGEPETLVSSSKTHMSCSHVRPSPDGKYLLFCMADYGAFPIFHTSSDLYLMDLQSRTFYQLPCNSPRSEGYHSWSSNSRWIAFTSRRDNGLYTRIYFSYVDKNGQVHKPFVLPQKDPYSNQRLFYSYSIPELITKPIPFSARDFIRAAADPKRVKKANLDPKVLQARKPERQPMPLTNYP